MSRSITVFGGSFDPVHDAHVEVARRALRQLPCDEVWFLPAARAVHKPAGATASPEHRRAMLELALEGQAGLTVCDHELRQGRPMRSVETMRALAREWPDHRWYFLIGEDSFRDLDAWYEPEELFRIAPPVVAPRPGASGIRAAHWAGIGVRWLAGDEIDLDSTSLRAALGRGENPGGIDPRVLGYIREHDLYLEQRA